MSKNRSQPPALSLKALQRVLEIDGLVRVAMRDCYTRDKAVTVLRTCVVESFDARISDCISRSNYDPIWISEIKRDSISSVIYFLPAWIKPPSRDAILKELQVTLDDHQRSKASLNPKKKPTKSQPTPDNETKPLGEQIRELRDESRLSNEKLAKALEVDIRSISRHLSSEHIPRNDHLVAYEDIFSETLKRPVRLDTSGKRQTSGKRP